MESIQTQYEPAHSSSHEEKEYEALGYKPDVSQDTEGTQPISSADFEWFVQNGYITYKSAPASAGIAASSDNETAEVKPLCDEAKESLIPSEAAIKVCNMEAVKEPSVQVKFSTAKPNAYSIWMPEEIERLRDEHALGKSVAQMAFLHGRSQGAIRGQLHKMSLIVPRKTCSKCKAPLRQVRKKAVKQA